MKKLLFTLTTLYFLLGQPCVAQRKPFVFTPDKMTHYFSVGVGLPLPTFIGYEYRLNEWSYGAEIGLIHTNMLANLSKSTNTNPKNIKYFIGGKPLELSERQFLLLNANEQLSIRFWYFFSCPLQYPFCPSQKF